MPRRAATAAPAPAFPAHATAADELTPTQIVERLDDYIVGQPKAKRAVAIALRNRQRRQRIPKDLREAVTPKNILMVGPTGVGKTELARRLAKLTNAPFIKVEATKFTTVGYHGCDVDTIIRDLMAQTVRAMERERVAQLMEEPATARRAETALLDALLRQEKLPRTVRRTGAASNGAAQVAVDTAASSVRSQRRAELQRQLRDGALEDTVVTIQLRPTRSAMVEAMSHVQDLHDFGNGLGMMVSFPRSTKRAMTVAAARRVLTRQAAEHLVDTECLFTDAVHAVEQHGIVFIDEVDKIVESRPSSGHDTVSTQAVQQDLLPLIEGTAVSTPFGRVRTDHILFIAAGAFSTARPADLMPEFQGRFPIRVELKAVTADDLRHILTRPTNALTKQYAALLATEQVSIDFTAEGLAEMASQAHTVNRDSGDDIGARRLFTVIETVLEDLSFSAEQHAGRTVTVDAEYVRTRLQPLVGNADLRRYIL